MAGVSFRFAKRCRFGKRYKQTNGGRCGDVSWSPIKRGEKKGKKANRGWLFLFALPRASSGETNYARGVRHLIGNAVGDTAGTSETP